MKPPAFAYHRPRSLADALDVLARLGAEAKVLAGGQSLVPLMSMRLAAPAALVDVNHVPGLDSVEVTADRVVVGALARHSRVEHDPEAYDAVPLLRRALLLVAHPTIRNRGTTVGSLVHGDPAAEMPAVLCLLDGFVTLRSASGSRDVPADAFFTGPMESDVRPGELAVSATFRRPPAGSRSSFLEVSRRHGDYAVCGVGAVVSDGTARVALIGVGAGPVLVPLDEPDDPDRVAAAVDAAIEPEDDIHATADYRRHLAQVLTRRALAEVS
ncbi:MAG: xanthine dehydrogenase family protein subunit M [Nocardioidaceae bacterium]|nr:xanthine dehydrogenase family protein subunit M [Nocardioidaceae bacterium]NUS50515.1 xanthine dehydrogenase family protein subunit M [Nocardioidaceae bacterium]